MLRKYAEYCNNGDFNGWLSLWNPRGVQMPPGTEAREGINEIRAGMAGNFQVPLELTITEIQDVIAYYDTGLTRCTYKLKITPPPPAPPIIFNGKALTIYARQFYGSWEIIYDCFNSNVP